MTTPVMPVDVGYFAASITYQASYMSSPLVISVGTGPDAHNIAWVWQSIDGWDSPDVSGQVIQRGADQGGWASPQYYGPRILTITLLASAPDQATRDLARALLQQAIPVSDLATLIYFEPLAKQVMFRRSGRITETYPTLTDVQFTCNLVCPDPRKYGTVLKQTPAATLAGLFYITVGSKAASTWTTVPFTLPVQNPPGTSLFYNAGTFETRPVVDVYGPVTRPALTNRQTGQTVSFSQVTLNTGDVLSVDFDARAATLNGAYQPADVVSAWWVLQPGAAVIQLSGGGAGGAQMVAYFRDSYI